MKRYKMGFDMRFFLVLGFVVMVVITPIVLVYGLTRAILGELWWGLMLPMNVHKLLIEEYIKRGDIIDLEGTENGDNPPPNDMNGNN